MSRRPGPRPGPGPGAASPPASRSGLDVSIREELFEEFTRRWGRGESPRAEDYADRLPGAGPGSLVELIYHEYCLAEASGQRPDPADFLHRFPGLRGSLARLFQLRRAFPAAGSGIPSAAGGRLPPFPAVHDEIGPYRLIRELGRGAFARVFLAAQADLEDRLVVVKVSAWPTPEPQLLARTSHPHIVAVLRAATTAEGLQILCMPFLGGATLAAVLAERHRRARWPRTGRELLADLDRVAAPEYPEARLDRPAREIVAALSYPQAIAWIVARLAEALDHALERGVTHGDLKPANILLAADGQPMLLDFNLSTDGTGWEPVQGNPSVPPASPEAGGTLAYMAPERLDRLADPAQARPAERGDRHRADIYALGLVLRETLTASPPGVPAGRPRSVRELAAVLARARRQEGQDAGPVASTIPSELRPILRRCLAPDPGDRYRHARELAEDLDRWRADLAPIHVAFPRWAEARRRTRRHRRALIAGGGCLVVGVITSLGVGSQLEQAQAHALQEQGATYHQSLIEQGERYDTRSRSQALAKLAMYWDSTTPGVYHFVGKRDWLREPDGDAATSALRLLDAYAVYGPDDWRQREEVQALPEPDRFDLELWILEQAWRHGRAVLAKEYDRFTEDRRRALEGIERLAARHPAAPLDRLTRALRRALDRPERPAHPARGTDRATSNAERYLLGLEAELLDPAEAALLGLDAETRAIGAAAALPHYRALLAARPDSYWAHYRMAAATMRLGRAEVAAGHLDFCLARRPHAPALHVLHATAHHAQGEIAEARLACGRALALAPDFVEALRARLILEPRPSDPAIVESILARSRLAMRAQGKLAQRTFAWETMLLPRRGQGEALQEWLDLGRDIVELRPEDLDTRFKYATQRHDAGEWEVALDQYNMILSRSPTYLPARYNRATLRQDQKWFGEAVADYAQIIGDPRLDELCHWTNNRAIIAFHMVSADQFRRGRHAEAIRLAELGLAHSRRRGDLEAESHYTLARAYAAAARGDPTLLDKVIEHLKAARELAPSLITMLLDDDPAMSGVRPLLPGDIR